MDNYIGRLLDNRYEILEVIGSGGMAVVYKARDHRLKRLIAVKILKDEYSQDDEFRRRFAAESQAVAMLSHPNIVSVYDVNSCDGINYIVMELIDGITLKQYMARRGQLNWRETLHFSLQIDKALEHAHGRGIVHRDIKPHNIMILKDGSVKVADFGIARMTSAQNTLTREALGSVHYISPEQAKGGKPDCRSDLYSLGVVMYEMMTAKTPFDGDTPVAVAIQHINGTAQQPTELNPEIPVGLEQITMHAMTADMDERYASATDMLNDLEEFRKNPAIVFAYASPAAAKAVPVIVPPVSANRGAGYVDGAAARRPNVADLYGDDDLDPQEEEKKSEKRTVLIVSIISLIAVLGVAYLLFGVLLKGILRADKPLEVPSFVGMSYKEIIPGNYPDFELEVVEWVYDDNVGHGYVVSQSPEANSQAQKGTKIELVLSRGEKQEIPVMPSLTGMDANTAQTLLVDMKLSLQIVMDHAFSDTVPEGYVAYTDPVENVKLEQGQTVKVYVSVGPEQEEEPEEELVSVPNVVGKKLEDAVNALRAEGLEVGIVREVDNDKEAGTVVSQSVYKGTETAKGTKIDLEVSKGPEEEEPEEEQEEPSDGTQNPTDDPNSGNTDEPGNEPPEEPEKTGTAVVSVTLPQQTSPVSVTLMIDGVPVSHDEGMTADGSTISIPIQGTGTKTVDVYYDDVFSHSITVTFG